MKLTYQHVKDHRINDIIETLERSKYKWGSVLLSEGTITYVLNALLELKQRRAEDRMKNSQQES